MIGLDEYQLVAKTTLVMGEKEDVDGLLARVVLGVCGESGEVAEAMKKYMRGDYDREHLRELLKKELGDVMWYVAALASLLGVNMSEIAQDNIDKLQSRKERGVLKGSGDDR